MNEPAHGNSRYVKRLIRWFRANRLAAAQLDLAEWRHYKAIWHGRRWNDSPKETLAVEAKTRRLENRVRRLGGDPNAR